ALEADGGKGAPPQPRERQAEAGELLLLPFGHPEHDLGRGVVTPLTNFGSVKFSDVAVDGHTLSAYGAHQFIATGDKASVSGSTVRTLTQARGGLISRPGKVLAAR